MMQKDRYATTGKELVDIRQASISEIYALPCGGTFVKRGILKEEEWNRCIALVSENRTPEEKIEKMFLVANVICSRVAKQMGKSEIDSEVIREYFLMEHSKVVDDRFRIMRDFHPVACSTYAGNVMAIKNGHSAVKTVLGEKEYRTDFERGLTIGDIVAVHFDFIVEKISKETAEMMNKVNSDT